MLVMPVALLIGLISMIAIASMQSVLLQQQIMTWQQPHVQLEAAALSEMHRAIHQAVEQVLDPDIGQPNTEVQLQEGHQMQVTHHTQTCGQVTLQAASGSDAQWFVAYAYLTTVKVAHAQMPQLQVSEQMYWQHRLVSDGQPFIQTSDFSSSSENHSIVQPTCLDTPSY